MLHFFYFLFAMKNTLRYKAHMSRSGTSIRFDEETMERMKSIADAAGVNVGTLVRIAVTDYCKKVEKDGEIKLPIDLNSLHKKKKS